MVTNAVTMQDVAVAASVSLATVSNVLNRPELVSGATADRVRGAMETLGYIRNGLARQLRVGSSNSVGLIVRDVRNPFFTDVACGAERRAAREGLSVIVANSDERVEREANYLELFEEQRLYGVLANPVNDDLKRLRRLREHGTPVVVLDYSVRDEFSSVAVDDVDGASMAVEHLAAIGRERVAFVGGPVRLRQVADRLLGAKLAAAARPNLSLTKIETSALTASAGREAGEKICALAQKDRPDAVFAANDLVALGVLQAFTSAGHVRVPDDIALIGYDDIDYASAAAVPLTSIRQPRELLGETALELLLNEAAGDVSHQQILFRPQLVVRKSTGTNAAEASGGTAM